MIGEVKYIPARVGGMSLVGVGKERPCSWGNYFWFSRSYDGGVFEGVRCLNMWAENLNTARERFLPDGMVKVMTWKTERCEYAIVIDDRIPKEWRYDKCCYTGCYRPPIEVATEIYETLGDPDFEMEWWTDPEMYHARRCEELISSKDGITSCWIKCHYPRNPAKAEELINALIERRKNT